MKTVQNTRERAGYSTLMVLMLIAVFLFSCGSSEKFQASSIVPAAEGNVNVKKDKNDNYVVKIHLVNLAESTMLDPPTDHYVVWMETKDGMTRNIGQIKSSHGLFSKKYTGDFKTVTTYKPERIFITGESETDARNPGRIILQTGKI
jgi:hypothetical protein